MGAPHGSHLDPKAIQKRRMRLSTDDASQSVAAYSKRLQNSVSSMMAAVRSYFI